MKEDISVLIVDDHNIVRDGLEALISAEPGMYIVGSASDGFMAVDLARKLRPDIVLMDLVMPRMDGVQATIEIRREQPETRILVLTSFAEDHQVFSAIRAGAIGYILKDSSSEQLIQAIRDAYRNIPCLQPEVAKRLFNDIQNQSAEDAPERLLTNREIEIMQHIALGKTNQEIADTLVLSERTVRTHITNILAKLRLSNRTQLALYALRQGIAFMDYTRSDFK